MGADDTKKGHDRVYRLLLVDDERMALVSSLHSFPWADHGFDRPLPVSNPHEALALLRSEYFDAVFIDIRMPELSGLDILRICRAEGIDVECVVLSGYSDFAYAKAALQMEALDYCLKPVLPEDAVPVLERLSARLFAKRCAGDPARVQRLDTMDDLHRLLSSRRARVAGKAVFLAALRCADLARRLPTLRRGPDEVFLLADAGTLLLVSGDAGQTAEGLAERFCQDEACRLCYGVMDTADLRPGKQLARLIAELENTTAKAPLLAVRPREANDAFARLLDYVDLHFAENLSLQALAEQYHLNYTYCSELFREITSKTFTKYLTARRMARARELIDRPGVNLTDVADAVGYNNYHHFAATFKSYYGQTPKAYRQQT